MREFLGSVPLLDPETGKLDPGVLPVIAAAGPILIEQPGPSIVTVDDGQFTEALTGGAELVRHPFTLDAPRIGTPFVRFHLQPDDPDAYVDDPLGVVLSLVSTDGTVQYGLTGQPGPLPVTHAVYVGNGIEGIDVLNAGELPDAPIQATTTDALDADSNVRGTASAASSMNNDHPASTIFLSSTCQVVCVHWNADRSDYRCSEAFAYDHQYGEQFFVAASEAVAGYPDAEFYISNSGGWCIPAGDRDDALAQSMLGAELGQWADAITGYADPPPPAIYTGGLNPVMGYRIAGVDSDGVVSSAVAATVNRGDKALDLDGANGFDAVAFYSSLNYGPFERIVFADDHGRHFDAASTLDPDDTVVPPVAPIEDARPVVGQGALLVSHLLPAGDYELVVLASTQQSAMRVKNLVAGV